MAYKKGYKKKHLLGIGSKKECGGQKNYRYPFKIRI